MKAKRRMILWAAVLGALTIPITGGAASLELETQDAFNSAVTSGSGIRGNVEWSGSGNQLTIGNSGGTEPRGGTVSAGTKSDNRLLIHGGNFTSGKGASAAEDGTTLSGNQVVVDGGNVSSLYGAYSAGYDTDLRDNQVTVSDGKNLQYIYGGYLQNAAGNVTGNRVSLTEGNAGLASYSSIWGGYLNYGNDGGQGSVDANQVTISGIRANLSTVYGGQNTGSEGTASGNVVILENVSGIASVYGGSRYYYSAYTSAAGEAEGNTIQIRDSEVGTAEYGAKGIYGGYSDNVTSDIHANTIEIIGGIMGNKDSFMPIGIYGGYRTDLSGEVRANAVSISGGAVIYGSVCGGQNGTSGGSVQSGDVAGNVVYIDGGTIAASDREPNAVYGGYGDYDDNEGGATQNVNGNQVCIAQGTSVDGNIYGGYSKGGDGEVGENVVTISGGRIGSEEDSLYEIYGGYRDSASGDVRNNGVRISGDETETSLRASVYGGYTSGDGNVSGNTIHVSGGEIQEVSAVIGGMTWIINGQEYVIGGTTKTSALYGGYTDGNGDITGNLVDLSGGTIATDVYGGYSEGSGTVGSNTVTLNGTVDVSNASLYGSNPSALHAEDNALIIDEWSGCVKKVKNFHMLTLQNIHWENKGTVLSITEGTEGDLADTEIHLKNVVFDDGTHIQAGDSMTFIDGNGINLGIRKENVDIDTHAFSAGVATVGTGQISVNEEGNIQYAIETVSRSAQTDVMAENRVVAAAFVNQGADIAADSLHLLDDGYHWGTQTFGAVYGNRSRYDVNSDLKVNGWSEIVGVGNIHRVKDGRLAWGVFYENGTGNYRTWNKFNNEMFRGDGSLVYNGGGAAVRLTKDSGAYYEASFRAGTLNSSMSDAVRDGEGNHYGFDSDSAYWGVHVGAGRLIRNGSGQWDIYGKYFHTYIDGDSFDMGGDRFDFDSVTSDRLRIGARYMPATEATWKVYYGAAYEYEFSGDSHMKAGRFDAPKQSLQGSTVFGEIGTVWGRKDSPWSMDINLRGYAGEREGFSGMVQLAYAF